MARWFVSQQVPSARPLGLGSKLYPSNMQRMLNKDLARFMQSLFHIRQNRASERKALLAGCTSRCSKLLIISKIFRVVLKLLRQNYIFHARLFLKNIILSFENFSFTLSDKSTVYGRFAKVLFANFWRRFAYVLGQSPNCFLLVSGWKNEV